MRPFLTLVRVFGLLGRLGVRGGGFVGLGGGAGDPARSNRLMRWRIILQAVAIVLFVLLLTLFRR